MAAGTAPVSLRGSKPSRHTRSAGERTSRARPESLRAALLESLQVSDEIVQLRLGDDPAPVRHADDRSLSDHAAAANHGDDLLVGVELVAEVLARERGDRLVGRERVGDTPE